jgi:basic membrane protein A and related proteins
MAIKQFETSRREILGGALSVAMGAAAGTLSGARVAQAKSVTVGIVYVGPRDDFGWNQSHAVAADALRKISGITVVEEENVPETVAVAKTMESMIHEDGVDLLLPTCFGYFDPFMLETAAKFPKVQFRHAGGLWLKDKHPANAGSYFGYLDQAHYIDGIAAGLSTKTNKLGFVAAKPITQVLRNINSFALGVRKVNPNAIIQVVFTGGWALPVREAEVTNAMIDQGCDVITCHIDSTKALMATAESRGAMTCGHNTNQAALAPKGFITGAEFLWETIYSQYAKDLTEGTKIPNIVRGGFDLGYVKNSPYGAGATPAAIKAADSERSALAKKAPIFVGPIKDNKGNTVVPNGVSLDNYDVSLESTNYLVEGIVGSTS